MANEANLELSNLVRWIADNRAVWDFLTDNYNADLDYENYIFLLQKLVAEKKVVFAALMITKIKHNCFINAALVNTIAVCIEQAGTLNENLLELFIRELRRCVTEKNALEAEMPI